MHTKLYFDCFLFVCVGVSGNVVPSTYKQKKTAVTAPPKAADGEDEKPAATDAAAADGGDGETPAGGAGRGNR